MHGRGETTTGVRQRAEQAETVITAKLAEDFARAGGDPTLAADQARFGRTTATRLGALPGHGGYNKARGFNVEDADHLDAICAFFADAGISPLIEVWACDASARLGALLARAGFYAAEVNATLLAKPDSTHKADPDPNTDPNPDPAPAPDPAVDIREIPAAADDADDAAYLDTLFAGYELAGASAAAQRAMMAIEHRSPRLRRYLAFIDGHPAAAAALYVDAGQSYFAGAATVPACRRHGCQSALIRRRLADASALHGLRALRGNVVVTTAFGSPSQANLERLGFTVAHTRTLWRRLDAC